MDDTMTKNFEAWRAELGRNGQNLLRSLEITDRLVRQAKQPGFHEDEWNELVTLFAVEEFRRVAANREARSWHEDIRLLHQFALVAEFNHQIRRITEIGNTVFLDVIETIILKDDRFSVNTLGVIEFDAAGRIRRNTTFQQWDPERVPVHIGRSSEQKT